MTDRWRTLRTKFLAVAVGIGIFVAGVLLLGATIMRNAERQQQESITQGVWPLTMNNRAQSELIRVRMREIDLVYQTDYFAMAAQLELLRSEQAIFTKSLGELAVSLGEDSALETLALDENWQRYRNELARISDAAMFLQFDEMKRIAMFESAERFKQVSNGLQRLAEQANSRATKSVRQAALEYERQRAIFIVVSVGGMALIALWLAWLARSITLRMEHLEKASERIAAGDFGETVDLGGADELTRLATAFNFMQQQLLTRDRALAEAHAELERRVEHRTNELNETNLFLSREIAEHNAAEEQLRLLSLAVEQTPVSLVITDVDAHIQYVNQAFTRSTGYTAMEVIGRTPRILKSGHTSQNEYQRLWQTVLSGQRWEGDFKTRRRDGSMFWERVHISPVTDKAGKITHFLAIRQNISERKEQEEAIRRQAHYDGLTSLPNRLLAMDRLTHAMHAADRNRQKVVLMFIDLDEFKKVNDTLGHDAGDDLLVQAAARLVESVRGEDTVGRLGGDEFLVIMGGLATALEAEAVALRILDAFRLPFSIAGQEATVFSSIGLACYPDDAVAPEDLLRFADQAMYNAKESGRNAYRYFSQAHFDHTVGYLAFERALRAGLAKEEFYLAYQPLVDAGSGRFMGVEALLRWKSEEFGEVEPQRFISAAERNGFIVELGAWALMNACATAERWMKDGRPSFVLSVNISPRQFRGERVLADVKRCLCATGLPPKCLQIEITEGVLTQKLPEAEAVLQGLVELGVRVILDDFGTGYASLSYLKRFPFHAFKIDREFIRDLSDDSDDKAMVMAAVRMGKALNLTVVAEGVETQEQAAWLTDIGCDGLQGFLYATPLTAEQLEARWLDTPQAVPVTTKESP